MSAHTPGPWVWDENGYALAPVNPTTAITTLFVLEHRSMIRRDETVDLDAVLTEDAANQRLIAAAPELLVVAQRIESALFMAGIDAADGSDNPLEALRFDAQKAIEKATQP